MHAVPGSVDCATPCNAYCTDDLHVDLAYDAPCRAVGYPSVVDHLHFALTATGLLEVLAIAPAPEALPVQVRYPDAGSARLMQAAGVPAEAWQAFRVTYRVPVAAS